MKNVLQKEDENRDLGFGSVVSGDSRQRLLNPDGTFNVQRKGLSFWSSLSLYHSLLTMPWGKFLLMIVMGYIGTNAFFALLYMLCGSDGLSSPDSGDLANAFARAFFFSVQTFSTIGYGHAYPKSLAANIIVAGESLFGLLGFAFAAGLLFARFSRPTAKILFSKYALIAPYRGITAFEFRIANARKNQIIELNAKVLFARFEDSNGINVRRFYGLDLERSKVVFFPLSWTVVHPIDESSPLYGLTPDDLKKSNAEFLILLTGIDETFSQNVHTRSSYRAEELIWNARFVNVFNDPTLESELTIDVGRLDMIELVNADATRDHSNLIVSNQSNQIS